MPLYKQRKVVRSDDGSLLRPALVALALILSVRGTSMANPRAITATNVRFQALTPTMIRMEYSPTGHFVDETSVAAINRDSWPEVAVTSKTESEWLIVATPNMTLRYKTGSGPFSKNNLIIKWTDKGKERAWKPGDVDDKNLGGVPAIARQSQHEGRHRSRPAQPQRLLPARRQQDRPVRQGHRLGQAAARGRTARTGTSSPTATTTHRP